MSYQTLTYAVAGRVATITLDRPGRMNAINLAMPGEIASAVDRERKPILTKYATEVERLYC